MTRYLRLLLGLAVVAGLYWGLGGFDAPEGGSDRSSTHPDSTALGAPDSMGTAIGGPDDGPSFGYSPAGYESRLVDQELAAIDDWETLTIGRNESFYVALQRAGLDHQTIMDVVGACEPHTDLRKVRRGDTFLLSRTEDGLDALRFDINDEKYVIVRAIEDGMETEVSDYPVERVVRAAQGEIRTNLFDALLQQDADPALADQLAEILGWNIDFFRDLRQGDTFVLLYAEYVHDGKRVRDPEVLAVRFVNDGDEHRAYRYENEFELPAFYDEAGNSLERQFLRAPLKFTRISSNFSYRRLHPVLKSYRPHWGVDYAAPTGTPVFATAPGKVTERSKDRGSGNFVGIRHGNGYQSFYLHLSRFAKGLKVGDSVDQGQVIGYVGSTGWATAPHLDYRIKKNGKWVNPRKLALPPADPVSEERLEEFKTILANYDARIEALPTASTTLVLERSLLSEGESTVR